MTPAGSSALALHERRLKERRQARLARPKATPRKARGAFELASLGGIFALLVLAGASALAIGGVGSWRGMGGVFGMGAGVGAGDQPAQPSGAFRVGSILLVPWSGKVCEERLFDNYTGRLVKDATIDCEARLMQEKILALVPEGGDDKKGRVLNMGGAFKR